MVGVGLGAVGPLLTRVVVDDAVAGSTAVLVPVVTALVVLALVQYGASFVRRYFAGRLSLDVQHDLRRRVFDAVARLDGERQDALRTGQVASRAITDLQLVQGLLSMVPFTLGTAALVVTSIAAMLWLSPLLTLVTLVVLPAAAIVTVRSRRDAVPGDLVGPAAGGGRRAAGRGDRHRRPGGQGLRSGGPRGRAAGGPARGGCSPSGCARPG